MNKSKGYRLLGLDFRSCCTSVVADGSNFYVHKLNRLLFMFEVSGQNLRLNLRLNLLALLCDKPSGQRLDLVDTHLDLSSCYLHTELP